MIALPLIEKIAELFIILLTTAGLVKLKIFHTEDSKVLSRISLNFVTPCVIFNSFMKELTPEVGRGLLTTFLLAFVFHALYIGVAQVCRKTWKANTVERASIIFTNAGNLIIPIVAYVLGQEWVIYVSGYVVTFNILCWTYGLRMFDHEGPLEIRKVLFNPNILAVIAGLLCLVTGIRLGGPLGVALSDVSAMIGPISMMISGLVLGGMKFTDLFANRRVWIVLLFRMVICSGLAVLLVLVTGITRRFPDLHPIVMISLLSAIAPAASNINQLAILYNHDARYATAINVITTLSCIVTMPLWILLFEAFA